jgi:succinate--hydroxymethylglutarate CoA-transferase
VFGTGNDRQFQKLCAAIGEPQLSSLSNYKSNQDRVAHRKELVATLEAIFKKKETDDWLELLKNIGIPYGPVNNIEKTFQHEQVIHRQMIQEIDHKTAGRIKVAGIPVKYSASKPAIRRPPPCLGEHTNEVLSQVLGLDLGRLDALKKNGVV